MDKIIFVGLDVDDNSFHAAAIDSLGNLIGEFSCKPSSGPLLSKLEKLKSAHPGSLKICYEAGYLGFSLCRDLRKAGFDCDVIAPSLIPELSGKKVKTDRLDSQKLAKYLSCGLLTVITVPTEESESERALIRSRIFSVKQLRATKLHILSLCRCMNLHFKQDTGSKSHWSQSHLDWLNKKLHTIELPALRRNMQILLQQYEQARRVVDAYDEEIQELAKTPKYAKKVKALDIYRGISTLSAMTLVTEIGDIKRFDHPRRLTSYFGMDVTEYSSGGKQRQYRITKMGNSYGRCVAIESSQKVFNPPRVCYSLRKRREGVDPHLVSIADRCMDRQYQKSNRMLHSGKNRNVIKVACAREMLGFIWESLQAVG